MTKKNLIKCPNCEYKGKAEILGEVDILGGVKVMRFGKSYTYITGQKFAIYCGTCGEQVYIKTK